MIEGRKKKGFVTAQARNRGVRPGVSWPFSKASFSRIPEQEASAFSDDYKRMNFRYQTITKRSKRNADGSPVGQKESHNDHKPVKKSRKTVAK